MPVAVTRELVATLSALPLQRAAAAAGVSPTAFKGACRTLGIARWTYQRGRCEAGTAETVSAAAAGEPGAAHCSVMDAEEGDEANFAGSFDS